MTRSLIPAALAAMLLSPAAQAQDAAKTLTIFNWPVYTAPALLAKFEAETGIEVTVEDDVEYREQTRRLRDGDNVDLVMIQNDEVPKYVAEGLLQPVDIAGLPNFKNLEPRWQAREWDPKAEYTVPWMWGTTAFAIDTAVYGGPVDSLKTLYEPPEVMRGKVGMWGGAADIPLALQYLGAAQCSTDPATLAAVGDLLRKQRPFVAETSHEVEDFVADMASGRLSLAEGYSGRTREAREKRPSVRYVYPKEGVLAWMDNVAVAAKAPHKDNAMAFLNFIMAPENIALQQDYTFGYQSAVAGSHRFVDPAIADAPEANPPADLKITFVKACPPEVTAAYEKLAAEVNGG